MENIDDEEIEHLYQVVTHEEGIVERALDLIEHRRLDPDALDGARGYEMAGSTASSAIAVSPPDEYYKELTLTVTGYGFTGRRPTFSVTSGRVSLMLSVEEAADLAAKLEETLKAVKEKAS